MDYNKQKLYKSIMEKVAKTVKHSLNEAEKQHLNLRGDFEITQDQNTADSYRAYLNKIFKKKQLTVEDEVKLSEIIQTSDDENEVQKAKDTLVTHNLPFVISVVNKYKNSNVPKEDLVQAGNEGMIEAAGKYKPNPENPERFVSYAVWYIRRNIITELDSYSGAVKKTANAGFIVRAAQRFIEQYENEYGYEPDDEEILAELKKDPKFSTLTLDTLNQALDSDSNSTSLDSTIGSEDDSKTTVGDNIENRTFSSPDANLNNEDLERELENALIRVLGSRDANIVCDKWGINGRREMNVWEIAENNDMTETRINQILAVSFKKMAKDEETRQLLQYINA